MIALAAILWLLPPRTIVERTRTLKPAKQPHSSPR
jgi:hypothetical protein